MKVIVQDLWVGDRFVAHGSLWTYLGPDGDGKTATARKHSMGCLRLREKSYGYIGDVICSFALSDEVIFQPVLMPNPEPFVF
jgi:hypothetical protein